MENILKAVPPKIQYLQSKVQASRINDLSYYGCNELVDIIVMTKLLCVACMQITKRDIFSDSAALDVVDIAELKEAQIDADFETVEIWDMTIATWCDTIMDSLCMFGWDKKERLFFCKEEDSHATYKSTYLKPYSDFFERLAEEEEYGEPESEVCSFSNARLGKYKKFAASHEVDKRLRMQIDFELSHIATLFGANFCVDSLRSYGYEIVYIRTVDYSNEDYGTWLMNMDFLMPVHAANLEKLLDIAFERYPIEREES